RIRPLRIRKDVQIGDVEVVDEAVGVQEIGFRFAGKPYNHVDPDATVGDKRLDPLHPVGIQFPQIPAPHEAQDLVAPRLERYMKVRSKSIRSGYKVQYFISKQIGLDRRNPETRHIVHRVERADKVDKTVLPATVSYTKIPGIYPCKHDFTDSRIAHRPCGRHNVFYGLTAGFAAREGYRAERTGVVAAVLHLQEGPGPVVKRPRRVECVRSLYRRRQHARRWWPYKAVEELQQPKLLGGAEHGIHARDFSNLGGFQLGIAASYGDVCVG